MSQKGAFQLVGKFLSRAGLDSPDGSVALEGQHGGQIDLRAEKSAPQRVEELAVQHVEGHRRVYLPKIKPCTIYHYHLQFGSNFSPPKGHFWESGSDSIKGKARAKNGLCSFIVCSYSPSERFQQRESQVGRIGEDERGQQAVEDIGHLRAVNRERKGHQ